jgi:transposase
MRQEEKVKKAIWFYCFILLSSVLSAQDFRLPKIEANTDSLQNAFRALLDNTAGMGFIDYDSSWYYGDQTARYKAYLDSVLENMAYEKVRAYVEELDTAIKGFDWMNVSRSRQTEVERFMSMGSGNSVFTWELPSNIRNFNIWIGFFKNENDDIRKWLVNKKNKEGLYGMLNEIQQKFYTEYETKLDIFCTSWGL